MKNKRFDVYRCIQLPANLRDSVPRKNSGIKKTVFSPLAWHRMLLVLLTFFPFFGIGQTETETVLSEIERNNTTLRAYHQLNETEKLENNTGIFPENPEVGFNYLWSNPEVIGVRKDFSIAQAFDFPTAYGIKKKIAQAKNKQADLAFDLHRKSILFEAKSLCNQLIYTNAMNLELQKRVNHALDISKAYNAMFQEGEIGIIDKNKALFHLLNVQKELEQNESERKLLLAELSALNGGKEISFIQDTFLELVLPVNFEGWYKEYEAKNTALNRATNEIGISENEIKLNKAMNLPKFSAGYMSESVVGESFKGISLGMSIPLWENKNTVKYAAAKQQLAVEVANDLKIQTYHQLQGQYEKAIGLQKTLETYKSSLQSIDSAALLKKALDGGELSLIEYLLEISLYYETTDRFLAMEHELSQIAAGLFFFEL